MDYWQFIKQSSALNPSLKVVLFSLAPITCLSFMQLDLVLNSEDGGDLSDFITNGEWYLIGM